jgi:hypothetical protein
VKRLNYYSALQPHGVVCARRDQWKSIVKMGYLNPITPDDSSNVFVRRTIPYGRCRHLQLSEVIEGRIVQMKASNLMSVCFQQLGFSFVRHIFSPGLLIVVMDEQNSHIYVLLAIEY